MAISQGASLQHISDYIPIEGSVLSSVMKAGSVLQLSHNTPVDLSGHCLKKHTYSTSYSSPKYCQIRIFKNNFKSTNFSSADSSEAGNEGSE